MDAVLDAQLQRMETALNTLLDSIITYNPSVTAADNLLQADDELSRGLEQLTQHQNNYTRILQLRHEAELLDSKIKSSVQLLADVRKELLTIPLDASKETSRPVPYKDLLVYAKNISPFTIPPSFRPKPAAADDEKPAQPIDGAADTNEHILASTPVAGGGESSLTAIHDEDGNRTLNALSEEHKQWISDLGNLPFLPWPSDADMAVGALHALNYQTMHGNDPTDIARVLQEEEDKKLRDEEDRKRPDQPYASRHSGGAKPAEALPKRKARFGLDDSDDDDDDGY